MLIKDLKNKSFKATATVTSDHHLENRQAFIDNITRQVEEQGGTCYEKNNAIHINESNQFFHLPIRPKVIIGNLIFGTTRYGFHTVMSDERKMVCGDVPTKDQMTDTGFITGDVEYVLEPLEIK